MLSKSWEVPEKPTVVATVVPPKATESVVKECKRLGIGTVWIQPGSESDKAIEFCEKNGIEAVHGVCIMVKRKGCLVP